MRSFLETVLLSHNMCALASVACPHKGISVVGVKYQIAKDCVAIFTNAVSDRFISFAMFCINASGNSPLRIITLVVFPLKSFFCKDINLINGFFSFFTSINFCGKKEEGCF